MRTKSMRSGINRQRNNRKIGKPAIVGVLATALAALGTVAAVGAPAATASSRGHAQPGLSISQQYFGSTVEPYTGKETPTYRYTLTNGRGMSVDLLSYGGITQEINVPGRDGRTADVVLGFKTLQDYVANDSPPVTANGGPYFGETIGRYGNRIA